MSGNDGTTSKSIWKQRTYVQVSQRQSRVLHPASVQPARSCVWFGFVNKPLAAAQLAAERASRGGCTSATGLWLCLPVFNEQGFALCVSFLPSLATHCSSSSTRTAHSNACSTGHGQRTLSPSRNQESRSWTPARHRKPTQRHNTAQHLQGQNQEAQRAEDREQPIPPAWFAFRALQPLPALV